MNKVLGDLAVDSENDARLRETLHIYLRCGCSYTGAADELGLHFNSVKYRVGRAVARRGRPIDAYRLDSKWRWFCASGTTPQSFDRDRRNQPSRRCPPDNDDRPSSFPGNSVVTSVSA